MRNNDETNATYEATDPQTKKKNNRGTALDRSLEKLLEELSQFYTRENLSLDSDAAPPKSLLKHIEERVVI